MKNIKNFFNYALGDLFVKGILFISLPLLTRVMSPEQYGKLSILNTAILILYVLTSLNLQSAILNRYMKDKNGFSIYLSTCVIFLIPFHILLLLLTPIYAAPLSELLGFSPADFNFVLIICIMLSYIFIYTSYLQGAEKGAEYAKINVINKIGELALIFIFALYLSSDQYLSKIYAQLIITVPLLIYSFYKLRRFMVLRFNMDELKSALLFSVPLIIHVLSNSLLSQVDRIIINNTLGSGSAGIYSFSYNLGMCVIVLIMAWNSSWQPKLYQLINDRDSESIKKIQQASTLIFFIITSSCILFSKEMVLIMSSEEYYSGIYIVPLIIMGNALIHIYLMYVNFVFFEKKTLLISATTFIALAVNIAANYVLIPLYGIMGSAIATVIAYLFLCICHFISAKYIISLFDSSLINIKILFLFFAGMLIAYSLSLILDDLEWYKALIIKVMCVSLMCFYIIWNKTYKDLVA
ncbi:oligosaccharide flippase family protein [Pseudocitrobacter faecalis]|uniref:oligosaccharide flippase family protein n=1 Tax=Pseudocitrobacter faecalis TaxID=1398493 RepID=UPI003BA1B0B7